MFALTPMRKTLFTLLLLLTGFFSRAQSEKEITISIQPKFQNSALELGKKYFTSTSDTIQFETLRFYLSSFSFYKNEKQVFSETNSYHLIDVSAEKTLTIKIKVPASLQFDAIHFNLGVDSTTNVSGAMGGDLDPINGMYWTWQSGYIDFKIEGTDSKGNSNIELHIGGYTAPNATQRTVVLKSASSNIECHIALKELLNKLNGQTDKVMSPGVKASHVADIFSTVFTSSMQ